MGFVRGVLPLRHKYRDPFDNVEVHLRNALFAQDEFGHRLVCSFLVSTLCCAGTSAAYSRQHRHQVCYLVSDLGNKSALNND
jgi:hypothetical protein